MVSLKIFVRCGLMISKFDENGNLPPGVHSCEWEEFKERFGYNRRVDTRTDTRKGIRAIDLSRWTP